MKFTLLGKISASVVLFGFILLLAGCPYSSSVPIDEGTVKVPAGIEGKWMKSADKDTETPTYFEISKEDNTHATALKFEFSASDSIYESTKYHFTFSDVEGVIFLNAIEEGGSTYSLFKFVLDDGTKEITTYEVTDYIKESFNSSSELKTYIAKNKDLSFFYTNSIDTYIRMR